MYQQSPVLHIENQPSHIRKSQRQTTSPLDLYLSSLSPTGRRPIRSLLSTVLRHLGSSLNVDSYPWHQVTYAELHQAKAQLQSAQYSPRTINAAISAMRGIVRAAFHAGLSTSPQLLHLFAVKPAKVYRAASGRALTKGEVKKVLTACTRKHRPLAAKRNRALFMLGIGGGLRVAELTALNIEHVNIATGMVTIERAKGGRRRTIHLTKEARSALKQWIQLLPSRKGPLWLRLSKDGRLTNSRLSHSGLRHIMHSLADSAGIEKFSPHDLRRTFITRLLEHGIDLNTVRQLAGHSDISTTIHYDYRDISALKTVSRALKISESRPTYRVSAHYAHNVHQHG